MIPSELPTPQKVQTLQRTLNRKAKENPRWRAWSLYGDLCRGDVLETALVSVLRNAGAAGVDGVTTEMVKANAGAFRDGLQSELKSRSYRPSPVLRVWIPKADGKRRPLGIPTVKDRVVQTALVLLLQPICAAMMQGKREVVDADLSGYFDSIPHAELLRKVARRVSDGSILRLVKLFLKAPIVEEKNGKRSIHPNQSGTPQGGNLSPLLANIYLNDLDHKVNGNEDLNARLVRYADDMVILCRPGNGAALHQRLKAYLGRLGLTLNEAKTRCVDSAQTAFRFLGFDIGLRRSPRTRRMYTQVAPSHKAQLRVRESIRAELNRSTLTRSSVAVVRQVNRIVRGWGNYFHYRNCSAALAGMNRFLWQRLQRWLWQKYGRSLPRRSFFTLDWLYGQYQLHRLPTNAGWTR
jgi:retron-type reverse transcriptase